MFIEIVLVVYLSSVPSVNTDPTFVEVKKYIRKDLKVDDTKEQVYFEHYNPEELERVIDTQTKIITYNERP